jgi:glycosyltransferase involved in cell wall biosynthesis
VTPRVRLVGEGWFPDRPSGLNRYLRELLEALGQAGIDAEAVVQGPADDALPNVVVPTTASAPLVRRLVETTRAALPEADVLDAHFALYALAPALLRGRRPLVVHFQGPWSAESLAGGTSGGVSAWLKHQVERAVYGRAREAITLSGAFKRILVEQYGVLPWRVTVVPPGVDLDRFSPGDRVGARARLDLPGDGWLAVSVRRLVPRMGLDVLLEAWAASRPGGLLLIAGDGPARGRLEELSEQLGIQGSVRFLGRVPESDLVDLYRAADLTVVPSLDLEGFGLVVLESLACGTPALVSDAGGLPEAVKGLDPELVVPAGDVAALSQRLQEARDGVLPSAARCRRHATRFAWERIASENVDIYGRAARGEASGTRLRVVYLTHTARLSGAELALLRLLPALGSEVEPHVILAEDGRLTSRLVQAGVSVEVLPMGERARGASRDAIGLQAAPGSALYTARLARRLRQLRPDLVHASSLKAGLYGSVAARLCGIPVIWHVHDRIAPDYLSPRLAGLVQTAIRELPTAVIANSRATLETIPGAPHASIVPYAVAPHHPLAKARRGRRPLRVGIVGRIARWKGQDVFIDAFAKAFPRGSEEAVIVGAPLFGEDDRAYLSELQDLAQQRGLDGRVIFRGFKEDVAHELARLDVLVHASVQPEPFGQVIVEGMAAGLPVVASGAGGPVELIRTEENGILFPPGDVEALATALRRLAGDAALRARLGSAGKVKTERFAADCVAAEVAEVYRGVLTRRANGQDARLRATRGARSGDAVRSPPHVSYVSGKE